MNRYLTPKPLSRESFEPFGDVIDTDVASHYTINDGWAERFHDLAALDLTAEGGRPALNIFRALPRPLPVKLSVMERHCLGSQAFVSLGAEVFLVVVSMPGKAPSRPEDLFVFVSDGRQGVNYRAGVWHHPLLAIRKPVDFIVIDRIGTVADCEELSIDGWDISIAM